MRHIETSKKAKKGFSAVQLLAGAVAALMTVVITVPTASAQEQSAMCKNEGNRFVRFFGSSYVAKNQFCGVESQLRDAESEAEGLRAQLQTALATRSADQGRIAELEAALNAAGQCNAADLQSALSMSSDENAQLLNSQDGLTSQIAGLDLQIAQLRDTIGAQEAKLDVALTDNEDLKLEISDLQASLKAAETEASALRGERDNLQLSFDDLASRSRDDVGRLAGDLEGSASALASCKTDFMALQAASEAEGGSLGDLQAQLELATAKSAEKDDMIASLNAQIEGLKTQASLDLEGAKAELSTAANLAGEVPLLRGEIRNRDIRISGLEKDLIAQNETFEGRLAGLRNDNAVMQAKLDDLTNQNMQLQAELETQMTIATDAKAEMSGLMATTEDTSGRLGVLEALIGKRGSDLERSQEALAMALSSKASIDGQLTDARQSLSSTEALLATAEKEVKELKVGITDLRLSSQSAADQAKTKITDLETQLADTQAQAKQLRVDITALRTSALQSRTDAKNQIADLEAQLQNAGAETAAMVSSDEITLLESDNTRLAGRVTELMSQLKAAQRGNGDAGELQAQLIAAQDEIASLKNAMSRMGPAESSGELNSALRRWMEGIQTNDTSDGLFLNGDKLVLSSGVSLFQPGSARLSEGGERLLGSLGSELKETIEELPADSNWHLQVLGHADATPSGSRWPSNWELSSFRAATVVRTLQDAGLPAERLSAVGKGEFHPLVDEANAEAYAKNRRIELQFR